MDQEKDPFGSEALGNIFRSLPAHPDRVASRENSSLEFKRSWNWGDAAKYARTCAAFANARGGYIVFGIEDRPHKLVGLNNDKFQNIDPAKMTEFFNQHFAPEIRWNKHIYDLNGKQYGLVYASECQRKPVICTKADGEVLKEGEIYYRYRGQTTTVRYSELREMIEQQRDEEKRLWLSHLRRMASIGSRDVGIFNIRTGQVTGAGGAFLIDEALLSQVCFIREGEFCEVTGKPTLRVIGEAKPLASGLTITGKEIIKTKGIRLSDIVLAFLEDQPVSDPAEYIKQICHETTAFLPVYYFMRLGKLDLEGGLSVIGSTICRSGARGKLETRLSKGTSQALDLPTASTPSGRQKLCYREAAMKQNLPEDLSGRNLVQCLQAMRTLQEADAATSAEYLKKKLRGWFNKHYASADGSVADSLRRTIAWLDEALHRNAVLAATALPSQP